MFARILVVDDEPDMEPLMMRRFRRELRAGEIEFTFALDGIQALSKIDANSRFDMVLCDINMPNMDGLTLLGHLAERDPLLKTIMVSAYGDMANIRTAMNRGAFDFVTKPIEFEDLKATIDKTLSEITILREAIERQETAERAKFNLSRYFPESLVETLSQTDEPFGPPREQNVAVLFADIVGFTSISAALPPEKVFELIRAFHSSVAQEIFEAHGTLDKYLGDGLMATFGTPASTGADNSNAIRCAQGMVRGIERLNVSRAAMGEAPIQLAVGVDYGPALLGNIGDERRLEFATIGDTVNIANRLQELCRTLVTPVVVSDAVVQAAQAEASNGPAILKRFSARGVMAVRGLDEPISVWTLAT
jgi:adenylate cyclase